MKTIRKLSPAVLAFALLAACAGIPQTKKTGPFFTATFGETVPAAKDGTSEAELDLSLVLVDTNQDGLRELVRSLLYAGRSAEEYAADVTDDWKVTYRETSEEYSSWGGDTFDQSWAYNEEQALVLTGPYAVISRNVYIFEGGAHGNYATDYFLIDTQNILQLKTVDIILPENTGVLKSLLEKELRRFAKEKIDKNLPPNEPLSVLGFFIDSDGVPVSDDINPLKEGIVFQYDPYILGPYAVGAIELLVPWDDLDGLLSPEGKNLAAVFMAERR
jgi:hypothetical protein